MKIKNIILVLTTILSFCIMSPTVFVQATPGNPSTSLPTEEPDPDEDSEPDSEPEPEPEPETEPVKPEEPADPESEESQEEEPNPTTDKEAQKDREDKKPTESKDNSDGKGESSKEKEKPSTSNNHSNNKNNSSPSESSWERPSSNSSSNSTWQNTDNEENATEEMEVLEEEDTEPVAWTLEEMLENNARVSVVDGIYYAVIGEEQQEITEEVAITLGYEPEVETEEALYDDYVEAYHTAMRNKGIEMLPLHDPEYDMELVAQPDYEEASDQVVASNVELDAFSGQKILAFSVLGIAAVVLVLVYVVKRRRA